MIYPGDSQFIQWNNHHRLLCIVHFVLYITIWLRNGLLCGIREDDIQSGILLVLLSYGGTHLRSFFTFPVCFLCWTIIEWSILNSSTILPVNYKSSFSDCSQLVMFSDGWPPQSSFSRLLKYHCIICSLAVPNSTDSDLLFV